MKRALVALLVAGVLLASTLDLAVGATWAVGVIVLFALGRRVRLLPWLVLAATLAIGAAGWREGWIAPPEPASHEVGWLGGGDRPESGGKGPGRTESGKADVRTRLRSVEETELGLTGAEVERRAAAAVRLARTLEPVRSRAPREVAAFEAAARRLALTLTAPEFRDIERRRRASRAYLRALETRLDGTAGDAETREIARALDPAVMATVSLRPVREDLDRVDRATRALIRALGGGEPTVSALAAFTYDEPNGRMVGETRYAVVAGESTRLVAFEPGRLSGGSAREGEISYAIDDGPTRSSLPGDSSVGLGDGARRVELVERWTAPVTGEAVRPRLGWLTFRRVSVDPRARTGEVIATVRLEGGTLEAPVAMGLPLPRVEVLAAPRYAIHYVGRAGRLTAERGSDVWRPAPDTAAPGPLTFEVRPASVLVRNPVIAGLSAHVARPSLGAVLGLVGAAALTVVLVRRPRPVTA